MDASDNDDNIKITKINNHFLHNFITINDNLGIFINNNNIAFFIAFFVDKNLIFTIIGNINDAKKINDQLVILTTNNGISLLSTTKNEQWSKINSIKYSINNVDQVSNFVNNKIDNVDSTNNWISNGALTLKVKNDKLLNVVINKEQP